jgi:hypothetical protein
MEKEIWKDITGYEGYYQISTLADAKNINYSTLKGKLNGNDKNNINLIYC